MLFTVPQDALVGVALAQALGLAGASSIRSDDARRARRLREAMLFLGLLFLPTAYSFFHVWPDWAVLYFLDTVSAARWWAPLCFGGVFLVSAASYLLSERLIRGGRARFAWIVLGCALVLVAVVAVAFPERISRLGSFDAFAAGATTPAWESTRFLVHTAAACALLAAGLVLVIFSNARANREGGGR